MWCKENIKAVIFFLCCVGLMSFVGSISNVDEECEETHHKNGVPVTICKNKPRGDQNAQTIFQQNASST